jgi:hypothetical protein
LVGQSDYQIESVFKKGNLVCLSIHCHSPQ